MYDKAKTRRKIFAVSLTAAVMAGLLFVYDLNAAAVERGVHAVTSALSPMRALKERALRAELEALGPAEETDPAMPWSGVPVFVYHGIVKKADRFNMTEAAFKDQMFALRRAGYRTVTLKDFQAFVRGEKTLPPKSFLLTFDDGRTDSYEGADPILKTVGFNAVMFVASGASMPSEDVRWSYYVSPNDIKDMLASGRWEIGSHAVQASGGRIPIGEDGTEANFLSNRTWLEEEGRLEDRAEYAARAAHELQDSKRELERAFGVGVEAFSYPYGDYGQQSRNEPEAVATIGWLVSEAYRFAFRQVWPNDGEYAFNRAGADPYRLKRIETPTDWSGERLLAFLETARDKPLPYQDTFGRDAGWEATWGEARVRGDGLSLAAAPETTGAAAFLDGTRSWKDYAIEALFSRLEGSHLSLLARYEDPRNYLACTFGGGRVKIERVAGGGIEKLADAPVDAAVSATGTAAGMRVRGDAIECLIGGAAVVSASGTGGVGGVGVRTWDEDPGEAGLLVTRLSVIPLY